MSWGPEKILGGGACGGSFEKGDCEIPSPDCNFHQPPENTVSYQSMIREWRSDLCKGSEQVPATFCNERAKVHQNSELEINKSQD